MSQVVDDVPMAAVKGSDKTRDVGSIEHAICLVNLGLVARARGDLARGRELFERALEIGRDRAPDSIFTAQTLFNLANVTGQAGDLERAKTLISEAMELSKSALTLNIFLKSSS